MEFLNYGIGFQNNRELKGGTFFFPDLEQLYTVAPLEIFSWVLKIWQRFLVQIKDEILLEKIQKFFTPLTSFLPPFLLWILLIWSSKLDFHQSSNVKKGGKKLVRGVKNFWFEKYKYSALICTNNHNQILKTRENNYKWNGIILRAKIKIQNLTSANNFTSIFSKSKFLPPSLVFHPLYGIGTLMQIEFGASN